jgi:hypothetical protein
LYLIAAADLVAVYQRALQNDPQLREAEANRLAALESKPYSAALTVPDLLLMRQTRRQARKPRIAYGPAEQSICTQRVSAITFLKDDKSVSEFFCTVSFLKA